MQERPPQATSRPTSRAQAEEQHRAARAAALQALRESALFYQNAANALAQMQEQVRETSAEAGPSQL